MNIPTIQFVRRPLWQRILIAIWPPYERAKREEDQRIFEGVMQDWRDNAAPPCSEPPPLQSPKALTYYTMQLARAMANEAPWNADLIAIADALRIKYESMN